MLAHAAEEIGDKGKNVKAAIGGMGQFQVSLTKEDI